MMVIDSRGPWWVVPFSTLLGVIVGSALGFAANRLTVWLNAKKATEAFLAAIQIELGRLKEQLEFLAEKARQNVDLCSANGTPHTLIISLKTKVFDSQLSNLTDLSDPRINQIVHLYSDVGVVPDTVAYINDRIREMHEGYSIASIRERCQAQVMSASENLAKALDCLIQRASSLAAVK